VRVSVTALFVLVTALFVLVTALFVLYKIIAAVRRMRRGGRP
jgi:hypothetical protein